MFEKIVPINKDVHAKKRVKEITSIDFATKFHVAYVTLQEFTRAASIYPIVFLEDALKDDFMPVLLLGLKPGVNVFVGADGQHHVCIDEQSSLVSETEGAALFDISGTPTQVIDNVKCHLSEFQQMEVTINDFCAILAEHNMFTSLSPWVRENSGVKDFAGCYVINEERMNNLCDELFQEITNER